MYKSVVLTESVKPSPPSKQPCEHKWVHQITDYLIETENYYSKRFKRIDTYYCEKCLEIKEVVLKEEIVFNSGSKLYWFKG